MTVEQSILQGHAMTVEQSVYYIGGHHDWNNLFILQGHAVTVEHYFTGAHHDCGTPFILQGHAMTVEHSLFYRGTP